MRVIFILLSLSFAACKERSGVAINNEDSITKDSLDSNITSKPEIPSEKIYSNERFSDVTVTRTGDNTFLIKGQGQIFEANFGWVVEDGHDELQSGHQMTDDGAPEWGNFSFNITVTKVNPNSTLHIILFESSPKDGTRQYELPVLLY